MLSDCGSDTGTWVRLKQSFCNFQQKILLQNLHKAAEQGIVFRIDDH